MAAGEFVTWDFTPLAAWPWAINALTHLSLAIELLYPFLIWIAILRPLLLASVVALHLGIAVISPGLTEFAIAMIAANLAFTSGLWLRRLAAGQLQPALKIFFDGACPRCRATMALVTAADPDRVIDPVDITRVDVGSIDRRLTPEDCMHAMHVVSRAGTILLGFDAMRAISARLPLYWPLALIGSIPGLAWTGRRVYNRLAASRPRDVACTDEVCGIQSRRSRTSPLDRIQAHEPQLATATLMNTEENPQR
jgi:predicted DCC family thiol-disulfide oxidoreductase YuxK